MIISVGESISPREIEDVIYIHLSVLEAALIRVLDGKWDEALKAVVVLRERVRVRNTDILSFCKRNLAHFKTSKAVDFTDTLPETPTGKVMKRELSERYKGNREKSV